MATLEKVSSKMLNEEQTNSKTNSGADLSKNEAMVNSKINKAEYIRRWGCAASTALLDPHCEIFTLSTASKKENMEGIIGYRNENKCAVVFGDPVCSEEVRPLLVEQFHKFCKEKHWSVVYTTTTKEFADWAMKRGDCSASVQLVDELILDPQFDPTVGSKGHLLRKKMNHSEGEGVSVHEYTGKDENLEKSIEEVASTWLKSRQGTQIYLADFELFANRNGKRWFYAKKKDQVIGVLFLDQLEAHNGWLLNMQMAVPDAPNGTTELLVLNALQILRQEGCHYLSFGLVLSENIGEIVGLGKISTWIAQAVFKGAKRFFPLDNRRKYWEKFQVQKAPSYQLFVEPHVGLREIIGVLKALHVV